MTTLFVSMIADTIDYSELSTGQRQEATFVSAFTFSFKATSGLGGFLTGIFLELVDFPTGADVPDAMPQETLELLGIGGNCHICGLDSCHSNLAPLHIIPAGACRYSRELREKRDRRRPLGR